MHSFLFVGNHKSHPAQDYSRTSNINTRDDFIKRAEQEREKREVKFLFQSLVLHCIGHFVAYAKTTIFSD
ncbi:unnamed protein product [Rotaria magnacalcarata]|uniref:Uncharacterized protein n=1 Tax=Rotaria magnacalcarata TaxID=392030 RepID=A0A8S3H127_9BILA|nr:unnamed protein product [Rotaria magnacalcarata]